MLTKEAERGAREGKTREHIAGKVGLYGNEKVGKGSPWVGAV